MPEYVYLQWINWFATYHHRQLIKTYSSMSDSRIRHATGFEPLVICKFYDKRRKVFRVWVAPLIISTKYKNTVFSWNWCIIRNRMYSEMIHSWWKSFHHNLKFTCIDRKSDSRLQLSIDLIQNREFRSFDYSSHQ